MKLLFWRFFWDVQLFCTSILDDFRNDEGYWLKIRTRARRFSKISIFFNLFYLKKSSEKLAFNLGLFSKKWKKTHNFLVLVIRSQFYQSGWASLRVQRWSLKGGGVKWALPPVQVGLRKGEKKKLLLSLLFKTWKGIHTHLQCGTLKVMCFFSTKSEILHFKRKLFLFSFITNVY